MTPALRHDTGITARFTLLELLVALVITAVLAAAVLGVLRGLTDVRDQAAYRAQQDVLRQHCCNMLGADLRNMTTPGSNPAGTVTGECVETSGVRTDFLAFPTIANATRAGTFGGDMVRVEYELVSADASDAKVLVRRMFSNLLTADEEDPEERVLLPGAQSLAFAYWQSDQWVDSWDSSLQDNQLPGAVSVLLEWTPDPTRDVTDRIEIVVPLLVTADNSGAGGMGAGDRLDAGGEGRQ